MYATKTPIVYPDSAAVTVPSIVNEFADKGVKGVVLITAGFKEIDDKAGTELQEEVAAIANRGMG